MHLESISSGYECSFIKTEVVFIPVSLYQILVVDKIHLLLALKIFHYVGQKNWPLLGQLSKKQKKILFVSPD